MSSDACIALLLDGPLQSWGFASRFDRRTTALHPTRSGIIGILAAASGIDKLRASESAELEKFSGMRITVASLPRKDRFQRDVPICRLEDYHTVTGIRRASGKVDEDATVQTYRHYLLDARFGVLIEGAAEVLSGVATALKNPRWGIWLGRKSCIPASPVLICHESAQSAAWEGLLRAAGYAGNEPLTAFDHILEVAATEVGAEMLEDAPIGYGNPIGERHAPRWIRRVTKARA